MMQRRPITPRKVGSPRHVGMLETHASDFLTHSLTNAPPKKTAVSVRQVRQALSNKEDPSEIEDMGKLEDIINYSGLAADDAR